MQVVIYSIVGLLFGIINFLIFSPKKWQSLIYQVLKSFILINVTSLAFIRFALDKKYVLSSANYATSFIYKYFAVTLVVGFLLLIIQLFMTGIFQLSKTQGKRRVSQIILNVLAFILFALGAFLFVGSDWFISYFGELTPEQFIFNFNSPITGTASDFYVSIYNGPVLKVIFIVTLFGLLLVNPYDLVIKHTATVPNKVSKYILLATSVLLAVSGVLYSVQRLRLVEVYNAYFDDSPYIQDNYVNPDKTKIVFPEKKRNLVHIYLESYENSFYDKKNGGYMDDNLMPDLMALTKEGISFSESDKLGGPHQTYGSSWSVASMVNMSTGLPLKIPMNGNSYGKSGYFLPGATAIGNILNQEGYNQTIMFGADADFGGLTSFFNNHEDFHIYDVKYAREAGKIPKDYNVWWGFEDKKLYAFAKEEMTRLSQEGKPFNFTMENADTHFPDGYIEKDTPRPFEKQYANVIAHSQKEVVELVRWIMAQPFYDNTTIVLTGDHLSMDKNFFKGWDTDYHRTTTNLILNADFSNHDIKTSHRDFAPFDMYPTILSSMGVKIEGDRLGLGTDLSSSQKTLIERDGLDKVNEELSQNSKFYNHEFVSEKNTK
ncbi:sulfatase [Vagococcus penaei]|uniref:Sulfatase n=1 Tax=Vagococcus penaei TaxID=633807 RepID=A0A1Q2D3P6_9ENTE|nr:LTA synthase family protein [Vagococcus penaei]AQP53000.1 sulfatase [Vagococcus penaei]RSU02540.1 sulfatase [Vagococcus penaei]